MIPRRDMLGFGRYRERTTAPEWLNVFPAGQACLSRDKLKDGDLAALKADAAVHLHLPHRFPFAKSQSVSVSLPQVTANYCPFLTAFPLQPLPFLALADPDSTPGGPSAWLRPSKLLTRRFAPTKSSTTSVPHVCRLICPRTFTRRLPLEDVPSQHDNGGATATSEEARQIFTHDSNNRFLGTSFELRYPNCRRSRHTERPRDVRNNTAIKYICRA